MTFDVAKFLALTALLAGAGIGSAACTSSGDDKEGDGGSGGAGGSAGNPSTGGGHAGEGGGGEVAGNGGAGIEGGAGGAGGGEGGLGGGGGGGAAGAAGDGGAAGGGGSPECLATDAAFEGDPCAGVPDMRCDGADEGATNPFYDSCSAAFRANTAVLAAYVACLTGKDACAADAAEVAADCRAAVVPQACPVEGAAEACATIVGTCGDGLTTRTCTAMLNATAALDDNEYLLSCMDPAGEFYDDGLVADCTARLVSCSGVLAQ
ncbi:MAG TPA: hypothetical protein VEQ59_04115 [Polyangiaceae bacterium]|nr:hypothetical protein [Polyangiaceae bacterium]